MKKLTDLTEADMPKNFEELHNLLVGDEDYGFDIAMFFVPYGGMRNGIWFDSRYSTFEKTNMTDQFRPFFGGVLVDCSEKTRDEWNKLKYNRP
jgi:hypothetical protein